MSAGFRFRLPLNYQFSSMNISFYLTRPNSEVNTTIFARICYNGLQLKYYLNEKIHPSNWNSRSQQAKNSPRFKESPEFNQRLSDIRSQIQNTFLEYKRLHNGITPNPKTFKKALDLSIKKIEPEKVKALDFFGVFQEIIETSKSGVRVDPHSGQPLSRHTIKTYTTVYNHLKEFQRLKKYKVEFGNIDLEFYTDYTEFLIKHYELSPNSVGKDIKTIKLVMNEATERELNTNLKYRSRRFKAIQEKTESIYLSEKELADLKALDLSKNKRLETVRDMFLIGCYTGLRYSDYTMLRPENFKDGFIETKQAKTGNPVIIPIHKVTNEIMKKYKWNLPKPISNQKTNSYLKEIAPLVKSLNTTVSQTSVRKGKKSYVNYKKWELVTSHTARRSFATNQYKAGVPIVTIMAITGHKSEKSFLLYIKLTPDEHAKLLKKHWDRSAMLHAV